MLEQINNKKVNVNKFILKPNDSTGIHVHSFDYVIIPITDGNLKIVDKNKNELITNLVAGEPYFRKKGVEHNVINIGTNIIIFIEVEIK